MQFIRKEISKESEGSRLNGESKGLSNVLMAFAKASKFWKFGYGVYFYSYKKFSRTIIVSTLSTSLCTLYYSILLEEKPFLTMPNIFSLSTFNKDPVSYI